jgi:hypothetical protein
MVVALMAIIVAAGCGGDSDKGSTATRDLSTVPRIGLPVFISSLTKQQYLAQANGRCRESWADMSIDIPFQRRAQRAELNDSQRFAYFSRTSFFPRVQFWFDDISYLGAPRKDRVQIEDILKALQWAIFSGEEQHITSPELMVAVFGSFNRLARAYGLHECIINKESLQPLAMA